jgi:hypothetical protein
MEDRAIFEFTGPIHNGGTLTVTAHKDCVLFEVEQECAVDSYNDTFNCECLVPWDKVHEMIALLQGAAPT